MNATEYKKYHESFMQNNLGSTAGHTFACIFFTVQCSIYISIKQRYPVCCQYVYEYFMLVLPMIIAYTIIPEHIIVLNFIMIIILLYNFLFYYKNASKKFMQKNVIHKDKLPLVSCLRGLTYLITGLCILAVDFQAFPRYLAKTERYGYSLMDTGVGLFVIVSGLVYKDVKSQSLKEILKGNIKFVSILFILGVGRFVSVKKLDYQEHVTEYGVHWNFFFTIAVCKVISMLVLCFSDRALLLCSWTLVIHEFALYAGLQDWVFGNSPKISLISANREGISSALGYVSIYLFGVHIRQILLNKNCTKYETQMKLLHGTLLLWSLTYIIDYIRPTSRTLANAGYCIYIDTLLITMTAVLFFITVVFEDLNFQIPIILSLINSNGLLYFLICNFLTGVINLSIRTLLIPSSITFIILNIYMVATLAVVINLNVLGLKI